MASVLEDGAFDSPAFSDPDDYLDEELDQDEEIVLFKGKRPMINEDVGNLLLIDHVPVVGLDKKEKLLKFMKAKIDTGPPYLSMDMPSNDTSTLGIVFVEYSTNKDANVAKLHINGVRIDKSHTLSAQTFDEIRRYFEVGDDAPKLVRQHFKHIHSIYDWMMHENAWDQYSLVCGSSTEIHWNAIPRNKEVMKRDAFSDQPSQWSPKGTFLTSFHPQGVALWAGNDFERFARFAHTRVSHLIFSPQEKFILTSASIKISKTSDIFDLSIKIHDVITSIELLSFHLLNHTVESPYSAVKFSAEDQYMLRLDQGEVFVHESIDGQLAMIDKTSILGSTVPVVDYVLSPTNPCLIAYWTAERKDKPACVSVYDFISKFELRTKNLFNVISCHLSWQDKGQYLCVQVDRYTKIKYPKEDGADKPIYNSIYHNFEIFRVGERNCPVESLTIKFAVNHFSWEPNGGNRFLIIHDSTESQNGTKLRATFYQVTADDVQQICQFAIEVNEACWSPYGQFCVLSWTKGRMSQKMFFIDINEQSVIYSEEYPMLSKVSFDPTGRYVAACSLAQSQPSDAGYTIYSFQGKKLAKRRIYGLNQFEWRPRHPCILTDEQLKEVKRDMKKYSSKFKALDDVLASALTEEQSAARKVLTDRINSIRNTNTKRLKQEFKEKGKLRRGDTMKREDEFIQEEMCQLLSADQEGFIFTTENTSNRK
ncbi:hypothetical protein ACOME3_009036 [Neoechinorhynchus agilis]